MMSRKQWIGLCGERWVAGQIEQMGLRCRLLPDYMQAGADLIVEERLLVEVKIARPTIRKVRNKSGTISVSTRWQWDVSSVKCLAATVLILVAEDHDRICHPYVLPAWIMADRSQFQITSHPIKYTGLLADFLYNWDVLKFILRKGWNRGEPGPWAEVDHDQS